MSVKYYKHRSKDAIYKKDGNDIALKVVAVDNNWFYLPFDPGWWWRWKTLKRISKKEAFELLL